MSGQQQNNGSSHSYRATSQRYRTSHLWRRRLSSSKHQDVWLHAEGHDAVGLYLQLRGRPRRERQVADLRAVSAQTPVDAAALVTHQNPSAHGGPAGF